MNGNGHCLINENNDPYLRTVELCIYYTLYGESRDFSSNFTLGNCLFGSVKLTKNADPVKYKYSVYDIWYDSRSEFSFTDGSMWGNVITFGVDMSSTVHFAIEIKIS